MNDINSELILRFQPRWKTDIEVMVGKTNTKATYSTCVGTRYENGLVNNFETHGASYYFIMFFFFWFLNDVNVKKWGVQKIKTVNCRHYTRIHFASLLIATKALYRGSSVCSSSRPYRTIDFMSRKHLKTFTTGSVYRSSGQISRLL